MNDNVLTCICCGRITDLQMFSQRKDERMVGWIFVCKKCETPDEIKSVILTNSPDENNNWKTPPNSDSIEPKSFDLTKPARTIGGLSARFLGRVKSNEYPLVFAVQQEDGQEAVLEYTETGVYDLSNTVHYENLINIPEKIEWWINVYDNAVSAVASKLCKTRQEADEVDCITSLKRIACIHFIKGEGL